MREVLVNGKPNTAMMSFATLLDDSEIAAVIHFVRSTFMKGDTQNTVYHTLENGWPNHEQYRLAFPFALGEIPLDEPWENLKPDEVKGKQLYLSSCVSCHDRSKVKNDGIIWQSFPISWPRNAYDHKQEQQVDSISGASQYHVHHIKSVYQPKTEKEIKGEQIFKNNCAFCHAPDGTGKHWIGQYIQPPAKNFTQESIRKLFTKQTLKQRIQNGVKGTAMPAWRYVLSDAEIESVASYLWERFN